MLPEMELLQYVYKTADMGVEGIRAVQKHAEEKMRAALDRQLGEYERIRSEAGSMIRAQGDEPSGIGAMARISSEMMSAGQLAMDDSRSKIAEMMIQGTGMGVVKTIRHLNDYEGQDDRARALAKELLDMQERNVEAMKAYL